MESKVKTISTFKVKLKMTPERVNAIKTIWYFYLCLTEIYDYLLYHYFNSLRANSERKLQPVCNSLWALFH